MNNYIYEVKSELNKAADEAYKSFMTNIQFCDASKKIKTVAVISYKPGEGKTTTCINLAVSMAQTGMNVLYVDADLRKPMAMKRLGNIELKGLSNYLLGYSTLDEIILPSNINGLNLIASGIKPVNPVELLNLKRFSYFLNNVREKYDMVIIDTPPLGSVIDCTLISSIADGTIIVMKPNKVQYKNAQKMMEQLKNANANVMGVVLNNLTKNEYRTFLENYNYFGDNKEYARIWHKKIVRGRNYD